VPAGDTHELPISNAVTPPHEIGQDSRGCSNRHARPVRDQPNRLLSCVVVARLLTSEITVADDRSVANPHRTRHGTCSIIASAPWPHQDELRRRHPILPSVQLRMARRCFAPNLTELA